MLQRFIFILNDNASLPEADHNRRKTTVVPFTAQDQSDSFEGFEVEANLVSEGEKGLR